VTRRSVVRGVGSYLPARVLTNAELSTMVDTSDEWIVQRSGIRQRHIAAEGETTADLGLKAAQAALESAGIDAQDIDLIVLATSTPDRTFPASATAIQDRLGIRHGVAFDLQAVCSGFVFAVATADKFLRSGSHNRALVIGSETFSRILDWTDRTTCVLFGDGAGAIVLEAQEQPDVAPALGRTAHAEALRGRRSFADGHGRAPAHGGPRGLQARRRDDHRRDERRLCRDRHDLRGP